ncbi:MAG: patatin-like phospholipase RssA [Porticoccaceae bacterium]|nr:patatin-like phospholipase RssA [Porticoccaceae bacterium]
MKKFKIGLALGSGAARGWAHIGVINALAKEGIEADIVCGTSIGALVGAAYVSNNLKKLQRAVTALTKFETAKFFGINSSFNGFVDTAKLGYFLQKHVAGKKALIEDAERRYAAVATDLNSGREIWLTDGAMLDAVWASIALPGIFHALKNNDKWLVDGGLVNPVPVSVCRALGADVVIAVNLNGDLVGRHWHRDDSDTEPEHHDDDEKIQNLGVVDKISGLLADYASSAFSGAKKEEQAPSFFSAIASSINIVQDRITRSRMAGDPPDIVLSPKLPAIGLLEFYRAAEAIAEGADCVQRMMPEIRHVLELD